jgi:N-acetyl-gamma-glutamyl-phosphate reductase
MLRVGVVGFRGYSGAELVKILVRHRGVEPWLVEHRSDAAERPRPRGHRALPSLAANAEAVRAADLAVVFLATPAEVSMELAPTMLEAGARVIDLSGAFRLGQAETYRRWYREEHTQPELLAEAVYGLPEFYRERIRKARLVANPGCYPTAANLALRPLVESGIADRTAGFICDAKSGVSGAGRKPTLKTSFCEVSENFSAYSVLDHRHVPEVLQNAGLRESEFTFTAHLLPLDRGILETIYLRTRDGCSAERILGVYEERYQGEPFVRLYEPGTLPDLRCVQHTNYCDIGFRHDPSTGRAVIVSVIDNLVKGAAGQAVQNMNLMLGFEETEGLLCGC